MTFGWQADEAASHRILDLALERGVTFIDTANVYGGSGQSGLSEEILGRWLSSHRHRCTISTKFGRPTGPAYNERGAGRANILQSVRASMQRLRTDYIDVLVIHEFDQLTPIEETLHCLDGLVASGAVRYIGCSNFATHQVMRALWCSDVRSLVPLTSAQVRYNLAQRVVEADFFPACRENGVGIVAYNVLAGGLFANDEPGRTGSRLGQSDLYRNWYMTERLLKYRNRLTRVAADCGIGLQDLALTWALRGSNVSVALLGGSHPEQIAALLGGSDKSSQVPVQLLDDLAIEFGVLPRPLGS
jgi:aryl-alcohol dehydrogenase-like predicted oxidoreductase